MEIPFSAVEIQTRSASGTHFQLVLFHSGTIIAWLVCSFPLMA